MSFGTQPAPNVRYVEVHYGDTLRRIALRELGDASRWIELATLNELRPPYIVPPEEVASGLIGFGALLKVPAPSSSVNHESNPNELFGTDLRLTGGRLTSDGGDITLVRGIPNLTQALRHHVMVEKRELAFHPEYGCWVRSLLGDVGGARSAELAAWYVESALLQDARVASVSSVVGEYVGDVLFVRAVVVPISGSAVELTLEV